MPQYFFEMQDAKRSTSYRKCEADDVRSAIKQINSKKWHVADPNATLMHIGYIPYEVISEDRSKAKLAGKRKEGYVLAADEKQASKILWENQCALADIIEADVNYTPASQEDTEENETAPSNEENEDSA